MSRPTRLVLACLLLAVLVRADDTPARERISFNVGWRFTEGDQAAIPDPITVRAMTDGLTGAEIQLTSQP